MTQLVILITGATGAIGSALATYYARPGIYLILQGRNLEALDNLSATCQQLGAEVKTVQLDLLDMAGLKKWTNELSTQQLPNLVIANAGINTNNGKKRQGETWDNVETLIDLNIKSTFALVNSLLPAMRQRGHGQIALMSSLAAYYGLPITPSYCASKAAIKSYGEALRGWLARENIKINVIMPGYIKSDMCSQMPGPKPFLCTPEKAAEIIANGLAKNKARITFPFPLNFGTWILSILPASFSQFILKYIGYGG